MSQSLDLVSFETLTPDDLAAACQRAMDGCDAIIADVVAVPAGTRTFANTLLPLEEGTDLVAAASGQYAFMAYVTANEDLRNTAREWDEKLDKYMVGLSFREDLYAAIKEYSESPEVKGLTGEESRWLEFELRDYRRNGFDLPLEQRQKVRGLFDRLVELDVQFRKNIDEYDDGLLLNREQLSAMPESWVENLTKVEERGVTKYKVSLDYPEIQPFMANCPDGELRRELFEKDQRKGGAVNVGILEDAIRLRNEIATMLGYDSWAAYRTETRMAKTRDAVTSFLRDLRGKVTIKAAADLQQMRGLAKERGAGDTINIWDWRFYHNELLKTKYQVDDFEVAKYFPLDAVTEGMFAVYQTILGVKFTEA